MTGPREWPPWLTVRVPAEGPAPRVEGTLRHLGLSTVCEQAQCPNIWDCFHRRTATFLVLGDRCTRDCRFCAVNPGPPAPPDPDEPQRVAEAARELGLQHVVITSVTRDDLGDGGAGHFAACIGAVRAALPEATVEVLVPDFGGSETALAAACQAAPDVFGHNVETVPRLYRQARPQAEYRRSLGVLRRATEGGLLVKSGLMVGLGETRDELAQVFADLAAAGCRLLTVGQYLRPSARQLPVERFVPPAEFDELRDLALAAGILGVAAGPLVRSSYRAAELAAELAAMGRKGCCQ